MFRKAIILSIMVVCMIVISCKQKTDPSENTFTPSQMESMFPKASEESLEEVKPEPPADGKYPMMSFVETEFDFGEITQGDKVEHTFAFKNTGEADLIITDAKSSCGCTVPEYPKNTPIKPGESGKMTVTFDSSGKLGPTAKTISVMCNTEKGNELLKIKTKINPKNKESKN